MLKWFKKLFNTKQPKQQVKHMNRAERRRLEKKVKKVYMYNLRKAPGLRKLRAERRLQASSLAKTYVNNQIKMELGLIPKLKPIDRFKAWWRVKTFRFKKKVKKS